MSFATPHRCNITRACREIPRGRTRFSALSEGVNRTIPPVFDSGPFRVRLLTVDYQRRVGYVPGGDFPPLPARPRPAGGQTPSGKHLARLNPFITEHFSAQLVVAAEPRLSLSPRGELRLVEAVDVRGNSLVPPARRSQSLVYASYFPARHGPVLETHALLHRPPEPAQNRRNCAARYRSPFLPAAPTP